MSNKPAHHELKHPFKKPSRREKQPEKTLTQREDRYRSILETIEDGYFEVDLAGSFTFFNDSLCRIVGYSQDEMMGMNYKKYMDPKTAKKVYQIFNSVFKTGEKAILYDWEIIAKTGASRSHESSVSLIRDLHGKPVGFRGIVRDITERKRAEEMLSESEKKYRTILDTMEDMYSEFDLTGKVVFRNRAAVKIVGYTEAESKGQSYKEFTTSETRKKLFEIFKKAYQTGESIKINEYEIIAKDGRILALEGIVSLKKDDSGNPIGFSVLAHDISERKRAELEQRKLESQLQHAQRMEAIGTLAGGIAHDFNNLLMSIQGDVSMMLYKLDPAHPHYARLKNIEYQIKNGSDLTRQLLGFSRGGKYEIKATNINEFIKLMTKVFGSTKKELNIKEKYQEDIWTVEIDRGQINQAILNLFVNACQAMNDGGDLFVQTENIILDETYVKPYNTEPGRFVKISVTDTGTGMGPEILKKVFDPFFTTKDLTRGIGLGLASTYGIVKNHGGIITAYSEKGLGSTFNIYLPVSEKDVIHEIETSKKILTGTETILFIDDEERILEAGIHMLELLGYNLIVCKNGDEAVKIYSEYKDDIDMVILDMIMPGMDGGEVFDRLKVIHPDVKVLLSSGYSINGNASKILERGCNGFIQKPFTMEQLSTRVREILDKK